MCVNYWPGCWIFMKQRRQRRIQSLDVKRRDGRREEIGRDRESPLMDNDSPKSQIKAETTASIMFKPPWGFCQWKQNRERGRETRNWGDPLTICITWSNEICCWFLFISMYVFHVLNISVWWKCSISFKRIFQTLPNRHILTRLLICRVLKYC